MDKPCVLQWRCVLLGLSRCPLARSSCGVCDGATLSHVKHKCSHARLHSDGQLQSVPRCSHARLPWCGGRHVPWCFRVFTCSINWDPRIGSGDLRILHDVNPDSFSQQAVVSDLRFEPLQSSSCGVCDGATLSHVKHKLVPSASLLQIVVLTF